MIWLILAITILSVYLTIYILRYGVPKSISDTYYQGMGVWFTVIMFICALTSVLGFTSVSDSTALKFIGFITSTALGFVGAAPNFKTQDNKVHFTAAIVFMLGAVIWSGLYSTWWVVAPLFITPVKLFKERWMFWLEVLCVFTIGLSLCVGSLI